MIEILPILNPESKAGNPRLLKLAQEFCEKHYGKVNLLDFRNVWVAVQGGPGEIPEVLGLACLRFSIDLPILHTEAGSGMKDKAVSAKLVQRVWASIMDQGFGGQEMLIHVAAGETEKWQPFLDEIKSVPADRHLVTIHPKIEV